MRIDPGGPVAVKRTCQQQKNVLCEYHLFNHPMEGLRSLSYLNKHKACDIKNTKNPKEHSNHVEWTCLHRFYLHSFFTTVIKQALARDNNIIFVLAVSICDKNAFVIRRLAWLSSTIGSLAPLDLDFTLPVMKQSTCWLVSKNIDQRWV
jgi:hypothetical protein